MDLTELWWSLLGLGFLVVPFLVAALGGVAIPASVLMLSGGLQARAGQHRLKPFKISEDGVWSARARKLTQLLTLAAVGLLAIAFPVLVALGCALWIACMLCPPRTAGLWSVLLLTTLFAWINAEKLVTGDMIWYAEHYLMLTRLPLQDYLGQRIGPFTIKWWEPVYYTIAFVLARLSNGSEVLLPIAITVLLYAPTGWALVRMCERYRLDTLQTVTTTLVTLQVIITFTLSTQLVRQEMAACLLFCAVVCWHFGARKGAIVLGTLSSLSHTSAVIPVLSVIFAALCCHQPTRTRKLTVIGLAALCMAMIGLAYTHFVSGDTELRSQVSDGAVHPALLGLDLTLWLIMVGLALWRKHNYGAGFLAVAAIVHLCFLAFLSNQPIPLLRMYFYIDLFRGGAVLCILLCLIKGGLSPSLYHGILLAGLVYTELRIIKSPFLYGGGVLRHLLMPVFIG